MFKILGTMQRLNYGQYDGTIQVLRVTSNYILLTFCVEEFFTIILTREPNILSLEVSFDTLLANSFLSIYNSMLFVFGFLPIRICKQYAF